ncbi:hypothetical protein BGX27_004905 [Mortierella sp. AM989]|nr:hypothetical protein BGX27_004905 [Mortierella sp. AM989]
MECQQQRRLGHSWISGHPHSILYKSPKTGSKASMAGYPNSTAGSGMNGVHSNSSGCSNGGNSSSAPLSSLFLDFAGNSRYQAYNMARFSTLSMASSSSSASTKTQDPSTDFHTQKQSFPAATNSNADKANSNPADADTQSSSSPSYSTASSSKDHHDDKEDDWAVNESYSGHGSNFTSPPSNTASTHDSRPSEFTSPSTPSTTYEDNSTNDDSESLTALRPSLSSFKHPAAIEASWRRTSDSLPSVISPSAATALSSASPSKAGGLDLSSSTLVQQMLFKERAPHSDDTERENSDWRQSDEGNSTGINSQHPNDDYADWDDEDHSTERKQNKTQIAKQAALESTIAGPSLTSMMLDQFKSEKSTSSDVLALPSNKPDNKHDSKLGQEEEDHISKLDIRVGIVRSVAAHPDAESLYIEQVDVGDKEGDQSKEPRTIVSGLVHHVPKDYLEGRAVIVVSNMKPSKLRGVVSQGMLLCAMEQDSNGEVVKVGLLEPAEGSQPGDKVTFENYTDEAYYKGAPFKTVQGFKEADFESNKVPRERNNIAGIAPYFDVAMYALVGQEGVPVRGWLERK